MRTKFFELEPEAAGFIGDKTVGDLHVRPLELKTLEYILEWEPTDDVIQSVTVYLITEQVKEALEAIGVTGAAFDHDNLKVKGDSQYRSTHKGLKCDLSKWWWLRVTGKGGIDDFGFSKTYSLVVSERVLNVLRRFKLEYCEVSEYRQLGLRD
jgi:hypothetical protein